MALESLDFVRPIAAELAVKRTASRESENPVRYSYQKLLREFNRTRAVYPEDPYVEVYTFRPGLYCLYTLSLDGMGDPWMFLIDGPEKALLIDTAFGLGDLRALCRRLVGEKPLIVVNTHCHFDHAYGNFQFEEVYCHEYELPALQEAMNPHIWDYLFDENGKGRWADFPREDLVPFRPYKIIPCPDGTVFDLGGDHRVELVHLGGHTPGHAGFLDTAHRIFFPGDDCCVGNVAILGSRPGNPNGWAASVETMADALERLYARRSEFDSLYPSHGPLETGPICLLSLLEACREVLADPSKADEQVERHFGPHTFTQCLKKIFESGHLMYGADSLYAHRQE